MDSHTGAEQRSTPQPEILPPGPVPSAAPPSERGWYPPPQTTPRAPRRRHWASAPATYWLVGINCAVFIAMVISGASIMAPTTQDILRWGGDSGPLVLLKGEWWRLLTAMFVHIGIIHLATNMWCLWNLGLLGEPLLGEFGMFAAYILTGLAGNLLDVAMRPGFSVSDPGNIVLGASAGASGAVFGLAGVLLILLRSPLLPIPAMELKKLRRSVWYFAIINLVIGIGANFTQSAVQIDNLAHIGGFLSGIALGFPLVPRIGAPRTTFVRRRALAFGGMTFLLLLVGWGLRAVYGLAGS
jgi:rhomboid protease GluP